jgi:hypothetical protein
MARLFLDANIIIDGNTSAISLPRVPVCALLRQVSSFVPSTPTPEAGKHNSKHTCDRST